jgi:signal transduction histidine kinase
MRSNAPAYGLSASLPIEQLRALLVAQPLPPNWISAIVDANGTFIAHAQEHEKIVGMKARPALLARMAQVKEDSVESFKLDGSPMFTAFSRSSISNWSVIVAMPRAALAEQLRQSRWLILAGTLLLLAASLLLAWFYAERIARSIHGLSNQALALGQGERIVSSPADFLEAQQLGLAFEHAADQLERAKAALVQRNLDLQQFSFVASHDLRSPLRSVKGLLTLLQKRHAGALDANGRELIARATGAVDQMDQLTHDLLDFARLESPARLSEAVDCNQVVASTLVFLDAAIAQSGAQIEVEPLPVVIGDRGQLIQLFQNLLANALKYCNGRTPIIRIRAQLETGKWVFEVADNGIGIESQHLQRIFEVFKRLHTMQEYPGNGIGLAICQRIVALHGGQIGARSELGRGSIFYFSLPDAKADTT